MIEEIKKLSGKFKSEFYSINKELDESIDHLSSKDALFIKKTCHSMNNLVETNDVEGLKKLIKSCQNR